MIQLVPIVANATPLQNNVSVAGIIIPRERDIIHTRSPVFNYHARPHSGEQLDIFHVQLGHID